MKLKTCAVLGAFLTMTAAIDAAAAPALVPEVPTWNKLLRLMGAAPASGQMSTKAVHPLIPLAGNTAGVCGSSFAAPGNGRKLWAIYMIGADLESGGAYATTNMAQLVAGWQQLASRDNVDLILAFGGAAKAGWQGVKYVDAAQLVADMSDGVLGNSGNYLYVDAQADMGQQATFESFLNYVNAHYGQDSRKMLTFWDHGSAYNVEPGIGPDENSGTVLAVNEINNALARTGSCYHLIGFDACLMASMESAVAVQDFAQYMVASEELEPGHGWNYTHVINAFSDQATNFGVGQAMVDSFVNGASHAEASDGKTLSVLDLAQVRATVQALDEASIRIAASMGSGNQQSVIQAFYNAQRYGGNLSVDPSVLPSQQSIDLKDFLSLLGDRSSDPALKQTLATASNAVSALVAYSRDDGTRPNSKGVTIAPLDMNAAYAAEQVGAGLMNPGWGRVVGTYADLKQQSAVPQAGTVGTDVTGAGLNYVSSRSHAPDTKAATTLNDELGIVARFDSAYLGDVRGAFGIADKTGNLTMLGELLAYELDDGRFFLPQWNGQGIALIDGSQPVYLPLFISEELDQGALFNTVIVIQRPGVAAPILGLMSVLPVNGKLAYDIRVIHEYGGQRQLTSQQADIRANDAVTFYTLKLLANGGSEIAILGDHTFANAPSLKEVPLTKGNYGYTLVGYDVGDYAGMATVQPVPELDRIFNWAAATRPDFNLESDSYLISGYYARCNAKLTTCIGAKDGNGWYYDGYSIQNLGATSQWLLQAVQAGY